MTEASSLRVSTFNVHAWRDAAGRPRVDDVIDLLREVDADVLVLNEVASPDHVLARVADALGATAVVAPANHGFNAILSRRPVTGGRAIALEVAEASPRSAVVATIAWPGAGPTGALDVVGTHLDYAREDVRVAQLRVLRAALAGLGPHVLAGDLNAMRLADYPPDALAALHAARALNEWEPARDDVCAALDAAGYVDAVRLAEAGRPARYRATLGAPVAPAHRVTSRVATRIDYLWLDAALARLVTAEAAATVATDTSDHALVAVTLRPTAETGCR